MVLLEDAFAVIDVDGSGTLDREEVANLMILMGKRCSSAALDGIILELDADGTGEIDFAEFKEYWSNHGGISELAEVSTPVYDAFGLIWLRNIYFC
jgi:Ca2+-binding EF-hand superfamily protein